jgi:hypothetical protein
MKYIEQKLKSDAQAFEAKFDSVLHDKIIAKLKNEPQEIKHSIASDNTRKFVFSGLTVLLVGLLMFPIVNKRTYTINGNSNKGSSNIQLINTKSENFVIEQLAFELETKMTNPLLREQQTLINDMNHIINLMFMN